MDSKSQFREPVREVPPPPPEVGGDVSKAKDEATAFATANYDDLAKKNDHGRRETVRDHLLSAVPLIFWLLIVLAVLAILIFGYHQFMPAGLHWLTEQQFSLWLSVDEGEW